MPNFDLSGTTITQNQIDTWRRLGITDEQINDSIEYNRQYNADAAFQRAEQQRLADEQRAREEADARIRQVQMEVKQIIEEGTKQAESAGRIPGATIEEVIANFPIDYAAAAAAVRRLEPSLTEEQALENVKAVAWGREPTITESTKAAAEAMREAAAKVVSPPPTEPAAAPAAAGPTSWLAGLAAAVGQGLPDYSDPAQAAAAAANDARLANDPAFVLSEIERTLQVIAQREAAGLDTTAQNSYLARLYQAQAGTPWHVTGQQPAPTPVQAGAGLFGVKGWQVFLAAGLAGLLLLLYGR